jgi:hypothetical protein
LKFDGTTPAGREPSFPEGAKNLKYRGNFSYNSRLVSLHPREIVAFPAKRAKIPEIALDKKKKQFSNFS